MLMASVVNVKGRRRRVVHCCRGWHGWLQDEDSSPLCAGPLVYSLHHRLGLQLAFALCIHWRWDMRMALV
jgi:hypothetical protein